MRALHQHPSADSHPADRAPALIDRFIPVRPADLVQALVTQSAEHGLDERDCRSFADALQHFLERENAALLRSIEHEYAPFNLDRETLPQPQDSFARTPAGYAALHERLRTLLLKANFTPLGNAELDRALDVAGARGMHVRLDPNAVEEFEIFIRGHGEVEEKRRSWRRPFHPQAASIPVYRRLVLVARLKKDPHVLLKMFKDIPERDIDALLPQARAAFRWRDRLLMASGGVGTLGTTLWKVIKLVSVGLFFVSQMLWVLLLGIGMLAWRAVSGYRIARVKHDWQRIHQLYYQSIANNQAVVALLTHMVVQEDAKEALLAYFLCAWPGPPANAAALRLAAEDYLRQRFGARVDFDVHDALRTLERLQLRSGSADLLVLPPRAAAERVQSRIFDDAVAAADTDVG